MSGSLTRWMSELMSAWSSDRACMTTITNLLDLEWPTISRDRRARQAIGRWGSRHPALLDADTPFDLIATCRSEPANRSHRILLSLAAEAADDALASRTALQLVVPIIACRARRAWRGAGPTASPLDDYEAEAAGAALERIHELINRPSERALFAVDDHVRHRLGVLYLADTKPKPTLRPLEHHHGDEDFARLLIEAVTKGCVSIAEASLIGTTRLGSASLAGLARETGERRPNLVHRRQRIELQLLSLASDRQPVMRSLLHQ
jgi:hypothetical protein